MTFVIEKFKSKTGASVSEEFTLFIVRPANRDWACQTERCHTLSNKASLQ